MKILLGVTGSVAAILTLKMVDRLLAAGHEVGVVATEPSLYFFDPDELARRAHSHNWPQAKSFRVYFEKDEWPTGGYVKDMPVLHIELREWADLMLIAPLTANTLAKMANGITDNLITSVVRAWDLKRKPLIVAPAMNTKMWEHPATKEHLEKLRSWYPLFDFVQPAVSRLACKDVGVGAMAHIDDILNVVNAHIPIIGKG